MKILVIRIGRAGDMVMMTPALTALIDKYPAADITVLTSPDGRRVLKDFHPQIKNIWILDRKKLLPFIQRIAGKRAGLKPLRSTEDQSSVAFDDLPATLAGLLRKA